jgi:hypothetical protein
MRRLMARRMPLFSVWSCRRIAACAALAMLSSRVASAAPFDARNVAADAKFVAFVDMEAERETAIGQACIAHMVADPGYAQFESDLTEWGGFTPSTDIADITVYGGSFAQGADAVVMVIHAKFDPVQLASLFALLPGSKKEVYADHEVISWHDGITRRQVFATFYDARTIVICSDAMRLARAIDMLIDPSKSLEPVKTFPRPPRSDAKPAQRDQRKIDAASGWFFMAGVGVGAAPRVANTLALSRVDVAALTVSEVDGKTIIHATSTTANDARGEDLFDFINGLKSVGSLMAWPSGNAVPATNVGLLAELARSTDVKHDATGVTATLTVTNERGVALLAKAVELRTLR